MFSTSIKELQASLRCMEPSCTDEVSMRELSQMQGSSTKAFSRVTAFIDWNAQIHLSHTDKKSDPVSVARVVFNKTTKRIANCLSLLEPNRRFTVSIRLYHGWHKGYEPTANRKAAQRVISEVDFSSISPRNNVIFNPDVEFGDCLLAACSERSHGKLAIHLPNTLREQGRKNIEEKMVDTALASDVVFSAHQSNSDWILVAAEDDDLVPPLFVAEAMIKSTGARVLLLRARTANNFLKLDNILVNG